MYHTYHKSRHLKKSLVLIVGSHNDGPSLTTGKARSTPTALSGSMQHSVRYDLVRQVILAGDLPLLYCLLQIYIQSFFCKLKLALKLQEQICPKNLKAIFSAFLGHTPLASLSTIQFQDEINLSLEEHFQEISLKVLFYLLA